MRHSVNSMIFLEFLLFVGTFSCYLYTRYVNTHIATVRGDIMLWPNYIFSNCLLQQESLWEYIHSWFSVNRRTHGIRRCAYRSKVGQWKTLRKKNCIEIFKNVALETLNEWYYCGPAFGSIIQVIQFFLIIYFYLGILDLICWFKKNI